MPGVSFQPVRIATVEEQDGLLAFAGGMLVGVLVRLSETHDGLTGYWFLEAMFGPGLDGALQPAAFPDLDAAGDWLARRVQRRG